MKALALALLCTLGCSSDGGSVDIVGPFTGHMYMFYVTGIDVPRDASEATSIADDLDGDGAPDNALGNVTALLATTNDLSTNGGDMISAGLLSSYVEVEADDLANDPTVGVRFFGYYTAEAVEVGGSIADGVFRSNRTRDTTHPGSAIINLPIYTNADPLMLPLEGLEIDMASEGSPSDFNAIIRGAIPEDDARTAAYEGLVQMFETEPERHLVFGRGIDANHDDVFSREELDDSLIATLVSADIEHYAGITKPAISVAIRMHLSQLPPIIGTPTCRDRVKNGDETDIDCGGPCQPCWTSKLCAASEDCQSRSCVGNRCAAPTCSDGVRDGYESDIDCGGSCAPCMASQRCAADRDCTSNRCNNGVGSLGTCS